MSIRALREMTSNHRTSRRICLRFATAYPRLMQSVEATGTQFEILLLELCRR